MARRHLTRLACWLVLVATGVRADTTPPRIPPIFFGTDNIKSCAQVVFDATDLPMTRSGGNCVVRPAANFFRGGACIGNASDYGNGQDHCTVDDYTARTLDLTNSTAVLLRTCGTSCSVDGDCAGGEVCQATRCTPIANLAACVASSDGIMTVGNGTRPIALGRLAYQALGGNGTGGAWSYDGSDTSTSGHQCAANGGPASMCAGGTCSGTYPNGTCTLSLTSNLFRTQLDGATAKSSTILTVSSFTLSGGTLKMAATGTANGGKLWIRSTGPVKITGGTIDMVGQGSAGAASGGCASSNAGKAGGVTSYLPGAAGASGNNAGTAGTNADAVAVAPFWSPVTLIGSGGGACPSSGQTSAAGLSASPPSYAGTGGGGGGCAASCGGTCGAGGRGGGEVHFETADTYTCTGATITTAGAAGATGGGGGGGGGGTHVQARKLGTNTCTYTVSAGAAGGSPPTNCGAGAAGGNGVTLFEEVPL